MDRGRHQQACGKQRKCDGLTHGNSLKRIRKPEEGRKAGMESLNRPVTAGGMKRIRSYSGQLQGCLNKGFVLQSIAAVECAQSFNRLHRDWVACSSVLLDDIHQPWEGSCWNNTV
jgi:hypothetical protein